MKQSIVALLGAIFLLFSFSGCGAADGADAYGNGLAQEPVAANNTQSAVDAQPPVEEAAEPAQPANDWAFDLPENHGVDPQILEALHKAADKTDIYAIVTIKDGYLIDEYYKEGYDKDSVFRLASCTKSFSGALIGIAIEEGLIDSVDAPLYIYFPQIAEPDGNPLKQQITIEHLLTHTSGIDWSEWNGGTMFRSLVESENWVDFVLSQPMASQPGAIFNYTTGGSHLLTAVLEQATGQSALEFARQHLFAPLGMDSVTWNQDPQGITDGGNGIGMSARDAAKFGQLYLNGGSWNGQQIVPEQWVALSTTTRSSGAGRSGTYGYQWWLRPFGAQEYDTYYAMGHGGQFIFVVPELQLVTVITSRFPQDTYAPWPYFSDYVLAACQA